MDERRKLKAVFNGTELAAAGGGVRFGQSVAFEGAGGVPTAEVATVRVTVVIEEGTRAEVLKRWVEVRRALGAGRGLLAVTGGSGAEVFRAYAEAESGSVPEAVEPGAEVPLVFKCRRPTTGSGSADHATLTPAGGTAATLPNVERVRQSLGNEFSSRRAASRKESVETTSMSGRLVADPGLPEAERQAELSRQRKLILAAGRSATAALAHGAIEEGPLTVRVTALEVEMPGPGKSELGWSLTAERLVFPEGQVAECELRITEAHDHDTGEVRLSVTGTVRAGSLTVAEAKVESLLTSYTAAGRVLKRKVVERREVESGDTGGEPAFVELSVTLEWAENSGVVSHDKRCETREDIRAGTKTVTFSGQVTGLDAAGALAAAREYRDVHLQAAPAKVVGNPVEYSEGEAREVRGEQGERLVRLDYRYSYEAPGEIEEVEITREEVSDAFGLPSVVVRGRATAATEAAARAALDLLRETGKMLVSETETEAERKTGGAEEFTSLAVERRYQSAQGAVSVRYGAETSVDSARMEKRVTVNGVATGPSRAAALAVAKGIAATEGAGGKLVEAKDRESRVRSGGQDLMEAVEFVFVYDLPVSAADVPATAGIVEAEWTVTRVFSVPKAVVTFIPFGEPHVQRDVGLLPGSVTVSGRVTGLPGAASTGLAWARGKKSAAGTLAPGPPTEAERTVSRAMEYETARLWELSFSYPFVGVVR